MFARDRDLLALEPGVFESVSWVGQRLIEGTGDVSGTTLTMTSAGSFEEAGVEAGHVVIVDGVSHEVIERGSPTTLEISRLRETLESAPKPGVTGTGLAFSVPSFGPQLGVVHGQVLRMLGIEPSDASGSPRESDVMNPDALRLVEALGALHLIYAGVSALSPSGSALGERAALYRAMRRARHASRT